MARMIRALVQRTLGAALGLSSVLACGCVDEVDLWPGGVDASAPASTRDATAAPPSGLDAMSPGQPFADAFSFPDGFGSDFGDAHGPPTMRRDSGPSCTLCASNGATCRNDSDCCSGRCESGSCLAGGTCLAPGLRCQTRNDCCSGRCEPNSVSGDLTCGYYCSANGAPCASAAQCCSFACNNGQCGGPICGSIGTLCQFNGDCCAGNCAAGRCMAGAGSCLPTAEACADDAGLPCCSGSCVSGRCDLGSGACRAVNTPCTASSMGNDPRGQCCVPESCEFSPVEGVPLCTAQCAQQGQTCNLNSDCCPGTTCEGTPSLHCVAVGTCP
jgi:hypothetical protein